MNDKNQSCQNPSRPVILCHDPREPVTFDLVRGRYDGFTEDAVAAIEQLVRCRPSNHILFDLYTAILGLHPAWTELTKAIASAAGIDLDRLEVLIKTADTGESSQSDYLAKLGRITSVAVGIANENEKPPRFLAPEHLLLAILEYGRETQQGDNFVELCKASRRAVSDFFKSKA